MARTGRPPVYTPEKALKICQRIAEGESLRSVCRDRAMPAYSTVVKWLGDKPAFSDQYAGARAAQADRMAEQILEIADGPQEDSLLDVNRSRLRVDTRKWLMARMSPKKYGERIEVENRAAPPSWDLDRLTYEERRRLKSYLLKMAGGDAVDAEFEVLKTKALT